MVFFTCYATQGGSWLIWNMPLCFRNEFPFDKNETFLAQFGPKNVAFFQLWIQPTNILICALEEDSMDIDSLIHSEVYLYFL